MLFILDNKYKVVNYLDSYEKTLHNIINNIVCTIIDIFSNRKV